MMPVRLEPAAPRSRVKHSITEPLPSHVQADLKSLMAGVDPRFLEGGSDV